MWVTATPKKARDPDHRSAGKPDLASWHRSGHRQQYRKLETPRGVWASPSFNAGPRRQVAEVAIPRDLFADILRLIAELRSPPDPAPA
jgi:hypothetical protein